MKKGRESKTQSGKYWNFWNSIKKAKYEGEAHAVEGIKAAGEKNWTAYAWLLERMYPDRWGKRQRVEMKHEGTLKHDVTVDRDYLKKVYDSDDYGFTTD
jgi:hypothetical protein